MHLKVLQEEQGAAKTEAMIEIERLFWPVKITDAAIPTLLIPIRPEWAYSWFDEDLASSTLFGAQKERAFNREGVYYSAARRPGIMMPGRILWYVTKDERIPGTGSVRACSRLDDMVVGKPKELYRQFQHLGIYEWTHVYQTAHRDLDTDLLAIRFSDTQLFSKPVSLAELEEITRQEQGIKPPIYAPSPISTDVFVRVYEMGMQLK
jgi:hypothetical protein